MPERFLQPIFDQAEQQFITKENQSYTKQLIEKSSMENFENDRKSINEVFGLEGYEITQVVVAANENEFWYEGRGVLIVKLRNKRNQIKEIVYKSFSLFINFMFSGQTSPIKSLCEKGLLKGKLCDYLYKVNGSIFEVINKDISPTLHTYKILPIEIDTETTDYMINSYGYIEFIYSETEMIQGKLKAFWYSIMYYLPIFCCGYDYSRYK